MLHTHTYVNIVQLKYGTYSSYDYSRIATRSCVWHKSADFLDEKHSTISIRRVLDDKLLFRKTWPWLQLMTLHDLSWGVLVVFSAFPPFIVHCYCVLCWCMN